MDINKMMTNGIFTMNGEYTQSKSNHNRFTIKQSQLYASFHTFYVRIYDDIFYDDILAIWLVY